MKSNSLVILSVVLLSTISASPIEDNLNVTISEKRDWIYAWYTDMSQDLPSQILGSVLPYGNYLLVDTNTRKTNNYIEFPFKQGSRGPNSLGCGLSTYVGADLNGAQDFGEEASLVYTVQFQDGFDFNMGGKLHGFFGGDLGNPCSGGQSSDNCFSARLMWRTGGLGEAYVYLPNMADQVPYYCPDNPGQCTMGISLSRGSFSFIPGNDQIISLSIKLNSFDGNGNPNRDGVLTLYVDSNLAIQRNDMLWRVRPDIKISAVFFNSFFGGGTQDWASPKDQSIYFTDMSVMSVV